MRSLTTKLNFIALLFCVTTTTFAQEGAMPEMPKPGPEHEHFKQEIGSWDVEIKAWMGPGDPTVTKGKETNRMLGGFWLVADFEGNMFGSDFEGHGIYGYDQEKKQYVGQWYDSLGSKPMAMVGTKDEAAKKMTYEGMAMGMDGKPAKHILTTHYHDDGTRTMTMHVKSGESTQKMFEMKYSKAATSSK